MLFRLTEAIELPKFVTPKEIINRLDKEQRVLLPEQPKENPTRKKILLENEEGI